MVPELLFHPTVPSGLSFYAKPEPPLTELLLMYPYGEKVHHKTESSRNTFIAERKILTVIIKSKCRGQISVIRILKIAVEELDKYEFKKKICQD